MWIKLAFKNVEKSLKDYAIYFLTLAFGVCIFYMFNSIYAQQNIMTVTPTTNQAMLALGQLLSYVSIFVAVILGFLIVYGNHYFIRRRKKELGMYLLLGMGKIETSIILIMETSLVALAALGAGLLSGVLGSQLMAIFTARIFEVDMPEFKFVFAPEAALKSLIYFGIIFLIVMCFNVFAITKFKLIDLLYGIRKNESMKLCRPWLSAVNFIFSLLSLSMAYYLLLTNGLMHINEKFFASIGLGLLGTFLFFFSLAGIVTAFVQANQKLYFNNLNIFVLRQISSKVNTNSISMSVVSLVLLMAIGIFSSGYSMQRMASAEMNLGTPYNVSIFKYAALERFGTTKISDQIAPLLEKNTALNGWHEFSLYSTVIQSKNLTTVNYGDLALENKNKLQFIKLSDYNQLLELSGKAAIALKRDHYYVNYGLAAYEKIALQFIDKKIDIKWQEHLLTPMDPVQMDRISNDIEPFLIVLEDNIVEGMATSGKVLNLNFVSKADEQSFVNRLRAYERTTDQKILGFDYFSSREEAYLTAIMTKAMVAYIGIYLGMVFMVTCAAILSIQQLTEAADNKNHYKLLKQLGTDQDMLNRALFIQVATYFVLPLALALIHSFFGLTAVNQILQVFGHTHSLANFGVTAVFIILVYGAYFTMTYMSCRNMIHQELR